MRRTGYVLALMLGSCTHGRIDPCAEIPYQGRQLFDPDFEAARAALFASAPAAEKAAAVRMGETSEGWDVRLVVADEPIGNTGPTARTFRREGCRVIDIQIEAGELAWGADASVYPTLVHEYVHAIVFSRSYRVTHLPRWILEGLAVWGANQLEEKARATLAKYLRRPLQLPLSELWSPPVLPAGKGEFSQEDYFMSGVFLSVALPDRESIAAFLALISEGSEWTSALEQVSGRTFEQNLSAARPSSSRNARSPGSTSSRTP